MKQTTKNILGVAAIVLLSSGVAGLTTYKMLNKEKPAAFSELFQQNPNNLLPAAFHATDAQPVDLTQAAESSLHAVVHIRILQGYLPARWHLDGGNAHTAHHADTEKKVMSVNS